MQSRHRSSTLLLVGALVACAFPVQAASRLAVVVTKSQKSLDAAATAVAQDPRVDADRFDLSKGTLEVDRLVEGISKKRFQGIVALGRGAHELVARVSRGTPFASALLGGADAGDHEVREIPSAAAWAEVLAGILPRGARVATIDSSGEMTDYLGQLRSALRPRGLDLVVHRIPKGKSVSSKAQGILQDCQAFFFPRSRELLNRTAALAIFKGAGSAKVPVFGFSASLLKVGATASLEIPPALLGQRAVDQVLGESTATAPPRLRLNLDRAKLLGLSVSSALRRRAGS